MAALPAGTLDGLERRMRAHQAKVALRGAPKIKVGHVGATVWVVGLGVGGCRDHGSLGKLNSRLCHLRCLFPFTTRFVCPLGVLMTATAIATAAPVTFTVVVYSRTYLCLHAVYAGAVSGGAQAATHWPEAAPVLREYLRVAPGSRAPWQLEALAEGFSKLPAFAKVPWQVREWE